MSASSAKSYLDAATFINAILSKNQNKSNQYLKGWLHCFGWRDGCEDKNCLFQTDPDYFAGWVLGQKQREEFFEAKRGI